MENVKFKVLRSHIGDRPYKAGDIRTARRPDVEHLIGTTLEDPEAKKETKKPAPKKSSPTKKATDKKQTVKKPAPKKKSAAKK